MMIGPVTAAVYTAANRVVIFRHLFICDVVVVVDQDAYCCIYTSATDLFKRTPAG
jgi:hypothetical protein